MRNLRNFLVLIAVWAVSMAAIAEQRVYIGGVGAAGGEIALMALDANAGQLATKGAAVAAAPGDGAEGVPASFLALHPSLPVLYGVGESPGIIAAFQIDTTTGRLTRLNQQPTVGAGPCHVAVAPGGAHVAVANYGGGSVALFPLDAAGTLAPASAFVQHEGSSAHPTRQTKPHAHSVNFDPSGKFLLAADLGTDQVLVYRYDAATGALAPNDPPPAALAPGAGPRHLVFHPTGRYVYVVNELDNTVSAFAFDAAAGRLDLIGSTGTLPADFTGDNTTAEVRAHPNGRFLYASNRGHDSIALFHIDQANGALNFINATPTGGKTPRNFNLDPSGAFLIAANQQSDTLHTFRIDAETGALSPTGDPVASPRPMCVLFARP